MSKRDYIAIAAAIKALAIDLIADSHDPERAEAHVAFHAEVMAGIFKADNPRFDKARFLAACGVAS